MAVKCDRSFCSGHFEYTGRVEVFAGIKLYEHECPLCGKVQWWESIIY